MKSVCAAAAETQREASPEGRRPSAVSQALRGWLEVSGQTPPDQAGGTGSLDGYTLQVALNPQTRERAYRLAHLAYCRCGHFSPGDFGGKYLLPHDEQPGTLTLLARNRSGEDVATVTLVYDSGAGLPCETLFKSELAALRREGRRLVEVSRLAMDAARQPPKALLVRLFNILYIHARLVRSHTDLLVEVVPRHAAYYRRLLEFEPLGPARKWPRGRDVMATLLRLDLLEAARRIEQARRGAPQRLYRHALSPAQERMIVGALGLPDTAFPLPTPDPLRPEALASPGPEKDRSR